MSDSSRPFAEESRQRPGVVLVGADVDTINAGMVKDVVARAAEGKLDPLIGRARRGSRSHDARGRWIATPRTDGSMTVSGRRCS